MLVPKYKKIYNTLHIPHVKTKTFGQHSFSYSAPKKWNSLPSDIRHSVLPCLQNSIKDLPLQTTTDFIFCLLSFLTPSPPHTHTPPLIPIAYLSLCSQIYVCVCVYVCVHVCVCWCVCVCLHVQSIVLCLYIIFVGLCVYL